MKNMLEKIRGNYKKDGVLSWLVVLCAFVANAIVCGIDVSFGETFGTIMKDFNSSESNVAWIASVHSSAQCFSASLSSMLAERFGFVPVIGIGILIASTSFILSTTAHNVSTLILYYGFFSGFGLGLIHTPANIICTYHFIKRQTLATGIAISGQAAGMVLVSEAMTFIDDRYGWKGCVIMCACICPFSVLLAIMAYILPEDSEETTIAENENNNLDEHVEGCR